MTVGSACESHYCSALLFKGHKKRDRLKYVVNYWLAAKSRKGVGPGFAIDHYPKHEFLGVNPIVRQTGWEDAGISRAIV